MKYKLQKVDTDQLQDQRKKKKLKNQLQTPLKKLKTNLKIVEQIEMDSTPTIKKQGQLKQKAQTPIVQAGRVHTNTKVIGERPGGPFKLPPAKFNTVPSPSRTKSPMGMNKQSNAQGSTKSLQRSYSIESMDSDTDCIVANLDLEDIINN